MSCIDLLLMCRSSRGEPVQDICTCCNSLLFSIIRLPLYRNSFYELYSTFSSVEFSTQHIIWYVEGARGMMFIKIMCHVDPQLLNKSSLIRLQRTSRLKWKQNKKQTITREARCAGQQTYSRSMADQWRHNSSFCPMPVRKRKYTRLFGHFP